MSPPSTRLTLIANLTLLNPLTQLFEIRHSQPVLKLQLFRGSLFHWWLFQMALCWNCEIFRTFHTNYTDDDVDGSRLVTRFSIGKCTAHSNDKTSTCFISATGDSTSHLAALLNYKTLLLPFNSLRAWRAWLEVGSPYSLWAERFCIRVTVCSSYSFKQKNCLWSFHVRVL